MNFKQFHFKSVFIIKARSCLLYIRIQIFMAVTTEKSRTKDYNCNWLSTSSSSCMMDVQLQTMYRTIDIDRLRTLDTITRLSTLLFEQSYWCLNRHLCILRERFAKKHLNLVIVCRKDVTLWCNVTSWRHVHGDGCSQTPVVYDYPFNFFERTVTKMWTLESIGAFRSDHSLNSDKYERDWPAQTKTFKLMIARWDKASLHLTEYHGENTLQRTYHHLDTEYERSVIRFAKR